MQENLIIFNIKTDSNDDILGITTPWINSLAKKFNNVYVISTSIGLIEVDNNVIVFSLGGESNKNLFFKLFSFYYYLIYILLRVRQNVVVFAHMTPLYLVISSPLLKLFRIRSVLWYAHKKITFTLRLASLLSDAITTIDQNSFKLDTKTKIYYLKHGITFPFFYNKIKKNKDFYKLSIVGRISEIKRIHYLIDAVIEIKKIHNIDIYLNIYGDIITQNDIKYKKRLIKLISENNFSSRIFFNGSKPHKIIGEIIMDSDLAFNLSIDCGLDKAGIEALSIGVPLIYTNPSYNKIFQDLNMDYSNYYIENLSTNILAQKIINLLSNNNNRLEDSLVRFVRDEYSVDSLTNKLFTILKKN